jgi:FkbM family methyltransferase
MGIRRLFAPLPANFFMTLVDVGSAGGLHKRWRPFQPILSSILFEPRVGGVVAGQLGRGQVRTYPVALSDQAGEANLHITALANMSSFLQPDPELFGRYCKKRSDARVVATQTVPVERLDALTEADGFRPDVLKVDTQGSELLVLKGAEKALRSVVLAEVEVSFLRRYAAQPLFAEIEAWMNARGFELIELHRLKRYRAANSLGIRRPLLGGGQKSGHVAYGDAIFVRSSDWFVQQAAADGGATVIKGILAMLAYGKADHAAALLDAGGEYLPPAVAQAIGGTLKTLNRRRLLQPVAAIFSRA